MSLREKIFKAYGDGVIGELEKRSVLLTPEEERVLVLVSWDGLWYGFKVGAVWATVVWGFVALFFR